MSDLNSNPKFSRYYKEISPSDIRIDKEEIFYRDKYNDIMNYIKVMLTNYENPTIQHYLKPKGALLVYIYPGTDIISFLKLISKNYYLDVIELNNVEILKSPEDFINNFNSILEESIKRKVNEKEPKSHIDNEQKSNGNKSNKNGEKKLLLINQRVDFEKILNEISLLKIFTSSQPDSNLLSFIDKGIILIWIDHDLQDVRDNSKDLFNTFDLFIKVPLLNKVERETFLRNFLEKHAKIAFDVNSIVTLTEQWEVNDIKQLLKVAIFKHFLNSELNDVSNEITDIIIDLIESGEYMPYIASESLNDQESEVEEGFYQNSIKNKKILKNGKEIAENIPNINILVKDIKEISTSEFMLNQLYEDAASKNYSELILIIDKISKKEVLEDIERKLLAKYPFILNDSPNMAQIYLEKAKKCIDHLRQALGK